jgi:hypothetical protein
LSIFRALKHFLEFLGIVFALKIFSENNKENYSYPFGPVTKLWLCSLNFPSVALPQAHLASAQAIHLSFVAQHRVSKCSSDSSFQFGPSPKARPGPHQPGREPTRGPSKPDHQWPWPPRQVVAATDSLACTLGILNVRAYLRWSTWPSVCPSCDAKPRMPLRALPSPLHSAASERLLDALPEEAGDTMSSMTMNLSRSTASRRELATGAPVPSQSPAASELDRRRRLPQNLTTPFGLHRWWACPRDPLLLLSRLPTSSPTLSR